MDKKGGGDFLLAQNILYDIESMRRFVGIDLSNEPVPDETTICKFRHLLETDKLGERIFKDINSHLESRGMRLSEGTIMDATIINAPSSTKNREKKQDPDMHSTKKSNQYYFGMKVHIGVDKDTELVHGLVTTSANIHDSRTVNDLLHRDKEAVGGSLGLHMGRTEGITGKAPNAVNNSNKRSTKNKNLTEEDKARNSQDAVQNTRQGRAYLRIGQDSLQGSGKERQPHLRAFCVIQPVEGEEASALAAFRGAVSPDTGQESRERGRAGHIKVLMTETQQKHRCLARVPHRGRTLLSWSRYCAFRLFCSEVA